MLIGSGAAAFEPTLGLAAIADAIRIGESRIERTRVQFHQPYRIRVGRAPVDTIDLVTPFRRLVIAVEEHLLLGGRSFRQQDAQAVLAQHGLILDVIVNLTFHPHNAYVGVPSYEVVLARGAPPIPVPPIRIARVPQSGPRVHGGPTASPYPGPWDGDTMLGGTVIASFDATRVDRRAPYDVVVSERGKELARTMVDLAGLR